ncbi:MAG: glycosyltransferase family 2 protein [Actinomycetota bacterium]|nr:glycosyltransferase family 2 protein [Actinomycetota bacterium]
MDGSNTHLSVSAVILTMGDRADMLRSVLERLSAEPVHEVLVVDNGPDGATATQTEGREGVRLLRPGGNTGIAGRNLAAREATGDLLLMLDDDSYPLPGAVDRLARAFGENPRLGAAGGLVRDVDGAGRVTEVDGVGSFDWFVRAGRTEPIGPEGLSADFFAEGGCMVRRSAYLEVGGFFEPYFFTCSEMDLSTRLVAARWDVRYFPEAAFDHLKPAGHGAGSRLALQYRIRNNVWYFWLRFPPSVAARRIPAYLAYDLMESVYRGMPGAWVKGVREAWVRRDSVRPYRDPVPKALIPRVEINRGRLHLRLLVDGLRKRVARSRSDDR